MPNEPKKIVRIDTIRATIVDEIEVDDAMYPVHQLTIGTHQRLAEAEAGNDYAVIRQAVKDVVPTLPDEKLARLTVDHAKAILFLAGSGIAAVEAMFPNVVSPESPTSPG